MKVANEPAAGHIAHDVLDRCKRQAGIRLVMHCQNDAGDDLQDHDQQQQ